LMPSFNYPLPNNRTFEPTSFFPMQPPMAISSTDNHHLTPLLPISTDNDEY
jgi:hypothetical protein